MDVFGWDAECAESRSTQSPGGSGSGRVVAMGYVVEWERASKRRDI